MVTPPEHPDADEPPVPPEARNAAEALEAGGGDGAPRVDASSDDAPRPQPQHDSAVAPEVLSARRRFSRRQVLLGGGVAAAVIVGAAAALSPGAERRGAPSRPAGPGNGGPGPDGVPDPLLPSGPRGAIRWRFESFGQDAWAPTYDAGVLYVGGAAGYALQASTGRTLWTFDAEDFVSVPAVAGDTVYLSSRSLYAVDAATGNERWRQEAPAAGGGAFGGPAHGDGQVFAGFGESLLRAFDAGTGAERWRAAVNGGVFASPTVADGRVYVSTADEAVQAFDTATGRHLWTHRTGRPFDDPITVADGTVFVAVADVAPAPGQGSSPVHGIRAVDAATGVTRWEYRTGRYAGNVAVSDGVAYTGTGGGTVIALDSATGRPIWRRDELFDAGGGTSLADGTLYVSGTRSFSALDAASGAVRWTGVSPEFFGLSRVVAADGLAVVCDDPGRLTAFSPPGEGVPA